MDDKVLIAKVRQKCQFYVDNGDGVAELLLADLCEQQLTRIAELDEEAENNFQQWMLWDRRYFVALDELTKIKSIIQSIGNYSVEHKAHCEMVVYPSDCTCGLTNLLLALKDINWGRNKFDCDKPEPVEDKGS